MNPKRVLVTGAAGFVGAVLVRRLLADGHEVHAIVRASSSPWRLADVDADLRWHALDLRDAAALDRALAAARPEVVFHLAAHGAYPAQTEVDDILSTNVTGTWNLLRGLGRRDYEILVNTGSSSEYGFRDTPMNEGDRPAPNSYYAVAKTSQTLLCQHVARAEGRPITTFRLFSIYGPYEEPTRLIPTIIRRCLSGEDLVLTSPQTARDFVFVDDAVDAYLRFDRLATLSGEVINIGSGTQKTLQEVVDLVLRHTGARVRCQWGTMPDRIWDAQTWVADATKSRRLLGWEPHTSLDQGIARTVAWNQEQRAVPRVA